jgi:predicted RNase H-like nuclease
VRAVLGAADHADAVARSRAACGAGIPVQAWHLVPKIREVDDLLRGASPEVRSAVRETHPELAFSLLGDGPCNHPKRTVAGRRERLARLRPWVPDRWTTPSQTPSGAARDDVLDALVLAVRAGQWLGSGPEASVCGGETDQYGLRMQIWG